MNPFQSNLIASGAGESEVFIWDLSNPSNPMSPGNKLHPLEDISGVAWNMQVQHILASTSPNGRSVVWDLRKNEPIIQVSDSNSRVSRLEKNIFMLILRWELHCIFDFNHNIVRIILFLSFLTL